MLKPLAMFFAFMMLFQSTTLSISTLVSIDDLLSHMQFHQETYGDSIMVFMSKHYGTEKHAHDSQHDHDPADHDRLPFNHNHHQCNHVPVVTFFTDYTAYLNPVIFRDFKKAKFIYTAPTSSIHVLGILQPPKTV